MPLPSAYNLLDTNKGDFTLNAAALAAILGGAALPVEGKFSDTVTTGINTESVATALVASLTHTIVGATALTKQVNVVATVANAGDAVKLAALTPGQLQIVFNEGAHAAAVFPAGAGYTIDGGAAGASVTLSEDLRAIFICVAPNTIISAQLGVASA